MPKVGSHAELVTRIAQKRSQLEAFITRMKPRKRLVNLTIVAGVVAAALTAGPAAGGATFTGWLTQTFGLTSPPWQILCAAATVCSVTATVATQLLKSQNIEEHVTKASLGTPSGPMLSWRSALPSASCTPRRSC